jgi:hypothetical protein
MHIGNIQNCFYQDSIYFYDILLGDVVSSLPPLAVQSNLYLDRLHETFRFNSVTKSRTVGRSPWTSDQVVARSLPVHKHRITHTQHKHQTSMLEAGFEPTITASERAKTILALDDSATVAGHVVSYIIWNVPDMKVTFWCSEAI